MEIIVETVNLWKVYETETDKVKALKGVNLKLRKGEFSLLMGASGSGKSTLLHLLGTLDKPTEGKVLYKGKDLSLLNSKELAVFRNKKIGFVFQFHYLINELTILENVMVPLLLAGEKKSEAKKKATELLQIIGLGYRLSHKPFEISGGEKQRAAIARALINSPEIVLADEPTGNLDTETAASVLSLMRELNKKFGTTFLIATHNKDLEKFADNIYFIKDGILLN
ncbi:ABC transporter ATP-binding protein [Desulfurobacterium thermolithotrophum]|uniref:ABC transporter ATP-binding protein n=1 Tax=Desulfurobacterium thermolithotrophum TaxID=64160 RepID=UPI0013D10E8A|nr:ABC transporter ATP-binding protein [Desulfurobacterium thermolithotrophum]